MESPTKHSFVVSPRFEVNEKMFIKMCVVLTKESQTTKIFETTTYRPSWTPTYFCWSLNKPVFQVIKNPLSHPQGGPLLVACRVLTRVLGVKKPELPNYFRPFIGAGPMSPSTSFQVSPSNLAKRRACRLGWVQTSRRHTHLRWCLKNFFSGKNEQKLIPYLWKDFLDTSIALFIARSFRLLCH